MSIKLIIYCKENHYFNDEYFTKFLDSTSLATLLSISLKIMIFSQKAIF